MLSLWNNPGDIPYILLTMAATGLAVLAGCRALRRPEQASRKRFNIIMTVGAAVWFLGDCVWLAHIVWARASGGAFYARQFLPGPALLAVVVSLVAVQVIHRRVVGCRKALLSAGAGSLAGGLPRARCVAGIGLGICVGGAVAGIMWWALIRVVLAYTARPPLEIP